MSEEHKHLHKHDHEEHGHEHEQSHQHDHDSKHSHEHEHTHDHGHQHALMTTSTATVTDMDTTMSMDTITNMGIATGTRLISMIRNTRRSLIAERRGSALISPRNWLKCSRCKEMNRFSTWRRVPVEWLGRWRSGLRAVGSLVLIRRSPCSTSATSTQIRFLRIIRAPVKPTLYHLSLTSFDRAFVSFSLHHFHNSEGVVKEVLRVLKNGGRFVVLDPVVEEAKDSVDIALEAKINQVFRRTHGNDFRFHTASSIQRLLTKAGYRIPRTNILSYSFNQEGMDGIPTGQHWLEAAEELETEAPELAARLKKNYFTWHKHDDHVHVKGSFSYALICGVKPD